ncbi:MAG: hypothetical protein WCA77_01535 [Thermoplasmata archaeon]
MRGPPRAPIHPPVAPRITYGEPEPASDEERFVGRSCYAFNHQLSTHLDDTRCSHCRYYLTARCPHIDEFLDDMDEMSPE